MPDRAHLPDLRRRIRELIAELPHNERTSTEVIVGRILENDRDLVEQCSEELCRKALNKLVADAFGTRATNLSPDQMDLFGSELRPPKYVTLPANRDDNKYGTRVPILGLTLREARNWIQEKKKRMQRQNPLAEFESLLDEFERQGLSSDLTLEEAMK